VRGHATQTRHGHPLEHGHPLALRFFRALEPLSDADGRLVHGALWQRQRGGSDAAKAEMREALVACATDGKIGIPSAARYDRGRTPAPAGVGAPTVQQFRSMFGSWANAQAAVLGLPETDPLSRRLLPYTPVFTREEVSDALREFHASLPAHERPSLS